MSTDRLLFEVYCCRQTATQALEVLCAAFLRVHGAGSDPGIGDLVENRAQHGWREVLTGQRGRVRYRAGPRYLASDDPDFTSVKDLARKHRGYINAYSASAKRIQWKYSDPTRRIRSNVVFATGH